MRKNSLGWIALIAVPLSSISAIAAPQFLNFPVPSYGPYSPGLMTTVLDHEQSYDMTADQLLIGQRGSNAPYGYTGGILSFTGELFLATSSYPAALHACYPKPANVHQSSAWSTTLSKYYTGTWDSGTGGNCQVGVALNYDGHPGYDYKISEFTPVYPAAGGSIIFNKCIPTFTNSQTCEYYGAIAVDHMNGFVTQYLHMANLNYGSARNGSNQRVGTDWKLGTVSKVGATAVHLHFEVLQRNPVTIDPNHYYSRKNYVVVDPYGYNTASYYADRLQSKPGCLWAAGCLF